jgi:hypothetical protein
MSSNPNLNIEFIQALFDISWLLMDFVRDKRYTFDGGPVKPRKGVPPEVLQAIVNLNFITSDTLAKFNRPDEDFQGEIPEEIIGEVDLGEV